MKLLLGLPAYGGQIHFTHVQGLIELATITAGHDFPVEYFWIANESLITRGRNICAARLMAGDCDRLMFIDADIGFDGSDVIKLMQLQDSDPRYDIIGGRYRVKDLSGDYACSYDSTGRLAAAFDPDTKEPVKVFAIGTGFMLIRRSVFERLATAFPDMACVSDGVPMMDYFACGPDPVTKRYLSEDYAFCARAASVGADTWLCPWIKLTHAGLHIFK